MPALPSISPCNCSSISTPSNTTALGTGRRGWVDNDQRGTLDIIWSCISTLFICIWTMLHLNLPASEDGFWDRVGRKARWMTMTLVTPELVLGIAYGQWVSAHRSVREMHSSGHKSWTITHAFYADMGGFMLRPKRGFDFPVTAKQLHYLVSQGYVAVPSITANEIWDKSNADKFLKCIALLQTLWLVLQMLARAIQHLPITTLELCTTSLVICTTAIFFLWYNKPLDVEEPTILDMNVSIAKVLVRAGNSARRPFSDVPLDFVEPRIYITSKWHEKLLRRLERWGYQKRPLLRMPNDRDPQYPNAWSHVLLAAVCASFGSLHLFAWNFSFPTTAELILWRVCAGTCWLTALFHALYEVPQRSREGYNLPHAVDLGGYKQRWPDCLWFFVPLGLYVLARICLLVETIVSMRSLPASAYKAITWTNLLPHV